MTELADVQGSSLTRALEVRVLPSPILSLYVCYRVTVGKTFRVLSSVSPSFGKKVKLADEQVDRLSGVMDRGTIGAFTFFRLHR